MKRNKNQLIQVIKIEDLITRKMNKNDYRARKHLTILMINQMMST
jgi:hypothetical protein